LTSAPNASLVDADVIRPKKTIARNMRRSYQIKAVATNQRRHEHIPNFSIVDDLDPDGKCVLMPIESDTMDDIEMEPRDFLYCLKLDFDIDAQLAAIRALLRQHLGASRAFNEEIARANFKKSGQGGLATAKMHSSRIQSSEAPILSKIKLLRARPDYVPPLI
jgi:hypothetical protein